jgi:multiple sugar transport system ATP-binding protein
VNVIFTIDAPPVATEELRAAISDEAGEEGIILADEEPRCVFVARVDARTQATPGATVRLTVDPSRFHFFDPETGHAIVTRRPAEVG